MAGFLEKALDLLGRRNRMVIEIIGEKRVQKGAGLKSRAKAELAPI